MIKKNISTFNSIRFVNCYTNEYDSKNDLPAMITVYLNKHNQYLKTIEYMWVKNDRYYRDNDLMCRYYNHNYIDLDDVSNEYIRNTDIKYSKNSDMYTYDICYRYNGYAHMYMSYKVEQNNYDITYINKFTNGICLTLLKIELDND